MTGSELVELQSPCRTASRRARRRRGAELLDRVGLSAAGPRRHVLRRDAPGLDLAMALIHDAAGGGQTAAPGPRARDGLRSRPCARGRRAVRRPPAEGCHLPIALRRAAAGIAPILRALDDAG
jgi:hypothetical protein